MGSILHAETHMPAASPEEAIVKGHALAQDMAAQEFIRQRFLHSVVVEVVDERDVVWARLPLHAAVAGSAKGPLTRADAMA
jgi:hypothetical protein